MWFFFFYPNGTQISMKQEIFVCDSNNGCIKVFNEDLELKRIFGSKGSGPGQFGFPSDLEFDSNGNIFVVEISNSQVYVLSPQKNTSILLANLEYFSLPPLQLFVKDLSL